MVGLAYFENTAAVSRYQHRSGLAWVDEIAQVRNWESGASALVDLDDDGDLDLVYGKLCADISNGATGLYGTNCANFAPNDDNCGAYDDADFTESRGCRFCHSGRSVDLPRNKRGNPLT